jgi:hypothetical protein
MEWDTHPGRRKISYHIMDLMAWEKAHGDGHHNERGDTGRHISLMPSSALASCWWYYLVGLHVAFCI